MLFVPSVTEGRAATFRGVPRRWSSENARTHDDISRGRKTKTHELARLGNPERKIPHTRLYVRTGETRRHSREFIFAIESRYDYAIRYNYYGRGPPSWSAR